MLAFYSDHFVLPLPDGHRFPMAKYSRLRQRVVQQGILAEAQLRPSPAASDQDLLRVHTAEYLERVIEGQLTAREVRRIGFPWSPEMVERSRRSVGGTISAVRAAFKEGCGLNLAGGTHHARPDSGAGFCVFNDVAVAARTAQAESAASRVLLLDCDVHQGDGSAAIFRDDPSVFTFSIHGAKNYPFHKVAGDLDLALDDGTGDDEYMDLLRQGVQRALALSNPDLVIYLSGADPYRKDAFGRLSLSKAGLLARDSWVFNLLASERLPTATVMGGGYARNIDDIVDIHLNTVAAAVSAWP
jgi:acetoin utilization deacetylase AcuC-like enzyme